MNELQPVDLDDVAAYLERRNLIRADEISYYVRWLQRFLAGPGADPRLSPQDAQRVFVEQLERSGQGGNRNPPTQIVAFCCFAVLARAGNGLPQATAVATHEPP